MTDFPYTPDVSDLTAATRDTRNILEDVDGWHIETLPADIVGAVSTAIHALRDAHRALEKAHCRARAQLGIDHAAVERHRVSVGEEYIARIRSEVREDRRTENRQDAAMETDDE